MKRPDPIKVIIGRSTSQFAREYCVARKRETTAMLKAELNQPKHSTSWLTITTAIIAVIVTALFAWEITGKEFAKWENMQRPQSGLK